MVSEVERSLRRDRGKGSMTTRLRLAASLEQLTDLCLNLSERLSELVLEDPADPQPEVKKEEAGASSSGLRPEDKGKEKVEEDWKPVPEFPKALSTETQPSFKQVVVEGSQSVLVTPVRQVKSESSVMAQPPNFATMNGPQFDQYWSNLPSEVAKQAAETAALTNGSDGCKIAALMKRDQRATANLAAVTSQLQQVKATAQAAAAGQGAKMSPPQKFENKETGPNIRQWLPTVEEYLTDTPDAQYLRFAVSYLAGKPKLYWVSQYAAWQAANPAAQGVMPYPPQPRQFFKDTMIRGYGIRDPAQSYWDSWNKLKQGADQSVDQYNVQFQQALADLGDQITDEQVKIEHYRAGLQADLREMCRTNPFGQRWAKLTDLVTYATLQWPTVEARLAKKKVSQPAKQVAGKRKQSGGSPGRSRAKLGALSAEQFEHNMKHRLCHKCGKPGHIAADCKSKSGNKKAKVSGESKSSKDFPTH